MTQNKLKIIACITMLIDHIGFLLFPSIVVLRYIGRISMPLFAFFIAEGCMYTRSRLRYFLNILSLALICQSAYFVEDMINGGIRSISLNILFTFALSIVVCFSFLKFKESLKSGSVKKQIACFAVFSAVLFLSFVLCEYAHRLPIPVHFDYGFAGVILPLFAAVFPDRARQLPLFFIGLLIFNLMLSGQLSYTWFSLLAIPLLLMYNGKRGTKKLKWVFYLFYPVHFAVLYLLSFVI